VPAVIGLHELTNGQGIEKLVGDDEKRIVADGVDLVGPVRMIPAEPRLLLCAERRIGFEQLQVQGVDKAFSARGHTERIFH
jgi:hypothetical protein